MPSSARHIQLTCKKKSWTETKLKVFITLQQFSVIRRASKRDSLTFQIHLRQQQKKKNVKTVCCESHKLSDCFWRVVRSLLRTWNFRSVASPRDSSCNVAMLIAAWVARSDRTLWRNFTLGSVYFTFHTHTLDDKEKVIFNFLRAVCCSSFFCCGHEHVTIAQMFSNFDRRRDFLCSSCHSWSINLICVCLSWLILYFLVWVSQQYKTAQRDLDVHIIQSQQRAQWFMDRAFVSSCSTLNWYLNSQQKKCVWGSTAAAARGGIVSLIRTYWALKPC